MYEAFFGAEEQIDVTRALADVYFAVYYTDLVNNRFKEIKCLNSVHELTKDIKQIDKAFEAFWGQGIAEDCREAVVRFTNYKTVSKRLAHSNSVSIEYHGTMSEYEWGRAHWIAAKRDDGGNVTHAIYAVEDITSQVKARLRKERELNENRKTLAENDDIMANAGIGIWHIYLTEGKKPRMKANPKMLELLGITDEKLSEEVIYDYWYSRIKEEALQSVTESVQEMMNGNRSENTYLWIHPTLGEQYVRCGGTSIRTKRNSYILRGYHYNVTEEVRREQKRQEQVERALEAAKRANAAKSTFLSQMSHDIRTPLNGIIGLLEIDEKHPDNIDLLKEDRAKAKIAANHLLSLINDVLEISKLEDDNVKLAREPYDLTQLYRDVVHIAEINATEAGIHIEEVSNGLPKKENYVYGSPLHVRQIFLNIFSNAIKYNKPNGIIRHKAELIKVSQSTQTYRITISDTGIGMSDEYLKHIFEPFTQERSDARSTYQGTGLGMTIVKSLVEKMKGKIEVISEPDVGSTFIITMPFEIAKDYNSKTVSENEENQDITDINILLTEDNELNIEIAQYLLEDQGAIVTVARDGKQALDLFANNPPGSFDVILMDVMMPVMNGLDATRAIRSLGRDDAKDIPILAMTANAFAEDVQKCKEAGMNAHLAKPLDMKKLLVEIAKYCKK